MSSAERMAAISPAPASRTRIAANGQRGSRDQRAEDRDRARRPDREEAAVAPEGAARRGPEPARQTAKPDRTSPRKGRRCVGAPCRCGTMGPCPRGSAASDSWGGSGSCPTSPSRSRPPSTVAARACSLSGRGGVGVSRLVTRGGSPGRPAAAAVPGHPVRRRARSGSGRVRADHRGLHALAREPRRRRAARCRRLRAPSRSRGCCPPSRRASRARFGTPGASRSRPSAAAPGSARRSRACSSGRGSAGRSCSSSRTSTTPTPGPASWPRSSPAWPAPRACASS